MSAAKTRKPISFAIAKLYNCDIPLAVCVFIARFITVSNSYYGIKRSERNCFREKLAISISRNNPRNDYVSSAYLFAAKSTNESVVACSIRSVPA